MMLQIRLLGGFALELDGESIVQRMSDRMQGLLVYLLLHRDRPQSRQHVAFQLWPDSTEAQARTNLRNLYSRLNQTLPDADLYIQGTTQTLVWRQDAPYRLDVADFERMVTAAIEAERSGGRERARDHLEQAVTLYRGELLPGSYDEWVMGPRDALRESFRQVLERLVRLWEEAGELSAATRYAQRLIDLEPLEEGSYITLMRLYGLLGDRVGVRRTYQQCVAILQRELNVPPSPATEQAYQEWLHREPAVPSVALGPQSVSLAQVLPLSGLPAIRPLPQPATPLIGREEELAELEYVLTDPAYRLITFSGPGGIGKTRLALQAAINGQSTFADGVAWVPLASVASPDSVAAAITDALGVSLQGLETVEVQLFRYLGDRHLLLVLDNFEHLLDGGEFLAELLQKAPHVKLLVTSRVRLDLQQEWVWELGGLALPEGNSVEAMTASGAVALFLQRAQRVQRGWTPTSEELSAIARICELVDGMPLGIELAAAWVRMLSPSEVVEEIERSLDFLVGVQRNIPERHRSLRTIFDQSFTMLNREEQRVLRQLSVFRGGFSRDAAERIAGGSLALLASLVDKSLVRRTTPTRYDLHEVVRQYAAEQLAEATREENATRAQHGRYYLTWLAQKGVALRGPDQSTARAAIGTEIDNLRRSWEWASSYQESDLLAEAAPAFWYYHELQSSDQEGEAVFRRAAEALSEAVPGTREAAIRGLLLSYQGWHLYRLGRLQEAVHLMEVSAPLLDDFSDFAAFGADPLKLRAFLLAVITRYDEAHEIFQQAAAIARAAADDWSVAQITMLVGSVYSTQRLLPEAYQVLLEALTMWRMLGDPRSTMICLNVIGAVAMRLGKLQESEAWLQESLALARTLGDGWGIAEGLTLVAESLRVQGKVDEALALFRESAALHRTINNHLGVAQAYRNIGDMLLEHDDIAGADAAYRDALRGVQAARTVPTLLEILVGFAKIHGRRGDVETAERWLAQVESHPAARQETRKRAAHQRAELENSSRLSSNPSPRTNEDEGSIVPIVEALLRSL